MRDKGPYPLCSLACRKATISSELVKDVITEVATCMRDFEGGVMYWSE